ncbi:MAG: malectin domain-containing carbohydrate-binding protein [Granulosicoccus sp.]
MLSYNAHSRTAARVALCLVAALMVFKSVIAADDASLDIKSIDEPGSGAELEISTRRVDFGGVTPGEAESAIVVFTHTGTPESDPLVIDNFFLDELDSKFYTLSTSAPLTLAPSESIDLIIGFEPDQLGQLPGRLTVSHSGESGVDVIDLYGEGVEKPILAAANPLSVPFGKSTLAGFGFKGGKPTSLQFGPDGRLYVAFMDGDIHVMDIERNNENKYAVTDTEAITLVKNITNHNDDGSIKKGLKKRLVTGLLVTGSANTPVIYVLSSDPRIGGGQSGNTTGLDTNSGILSRLTKTSKGWKKLDLVRGLPRSEENHHANGMALVGSTLYVAAGGNTNMGAMSNNFAMLPEYALSAAILSIDLDQIGDSTYDLPTLDDEDRSGPDDENDPFGGNRGKNQATLVEGGPVQVYAPGFRNPYDVVAMENGKIYSWDNGPNSGWGGAPGSCFNTRKEPGNTQHDGLHLITGPGYYAGHPNPTRGSQKNKFNKKNPQSPVPYANPIECKYYGPGTNGNGKHKNNKSLVSLPRSTNGLTEYTASNFSGAIKGDLLAVSWDNKVYRVSFKPSGQLDEMNVLFSNVGTTPLDITAQPDNAVFPGTIWVADLQGQKVVVYEPDDYEGGGVGVAGCVVNGGTGDADGDGFSDSDEIANGTDGCSAADVPADIDGDQLSDLIDPDDDNDNILDVDDPFAIDASNGASTPLPVDYQWENDSPDPGFIASLGFTGLMSNGVDNYQDQYDLNEMTIIGAAGVLTVDNVPDGDPLKAKNSQQYGFQFGVDVSSSSETFRVQTRILAPFSGFIPKLHQSMGLYIGTGDQDNYLKLIMKHNVVQVLTEVDGEIYFEQSDAVAFTQSDYVDLTLEVDPASAIATAYFQITRDDQTEQEVQVTTVDFPASWLSGSTRLAVGILSTSTKAEEFPATWDFLTVKPLEGINVVNQAPIVSIAAVDEVAVGAETQVTAMITDDGLPSNIISHQWNAISGPGAVTFADSTSPSTTVMFSEEGSYDLQLLVDDGDSTAADTVTVVVAGDENSDSNIVYRINAGGPRIFAEDGDWLSDSASAQYVSTGFTWKSSAKIDTSGITTAVPAQLFGSERYDRAGGAELKWKLPVTPGEYVVRLYFAEIYFGAMKVGGRVFDVTVEDQLVAGIDVFASVGANTAMMQSFTVQADDTLDIQLTRVLQNPAIKGIEVLKSGDTVAPEQPVTPLQNSPPVVSAGADTSTSLSEAVQLSGVVTDDGLPVNATKVAWSLSSGPDAVFFTTPESITTSARFSQSGTYVLRLSATDTKLGSFDELTVTVEDPPVVPVVVYRINTGGPSLEDASGNWAADIGSSSLASAGRPYTKVTAIDTSATPGVPARVFQSERWDAKGGAAMSWSLPVEPGNYDVHLYFAEIFTGAMDTGKRVFNVSVEGQSLPALDVYSEAGSNTALVKTFSFENTDGVININFGHMVENPSIKGIEVVARN